MEKTVVGNGVGPSARSLLLMNVLLLCVVSLVPATLRAQTAYGSVVGTATDATGAAIAGATVTITDPATGLAKVAKTDQSGNYSVVNLLPATYTVQVERTGFKRFLLDSVTVQVNTTIRVDAALSVGAVTETIEVNTQPPLLQTDSGTLSTEIEGAAVQEMPLNGRNTMNLLALAAGVVPQGSTSGGTGMNQAGSGHTNPSGWSNYNIGGGLTGESSVYLDGAPNSVLGGANGGNQIGLVQTQDAVQEFNVATNSASADFGRNGGGVVSMASKSGTNAFHGSVYEYLRNSFFNANDFFNKQSEIAKGAANKPLKWNQNQYGAVFGGPIKRDKAFFFFTWEGFSAITGQGTLTFVPTTNLSQGSDMMDGIFSTPITDPTGVCSISTTAHPGYWTITNLWGPNATTNTQYASVPQCGDPLANIMRTYYPPPNMPLNASGSNYYFAPPAIDKQNQYNGRVDYALSAKQRLFARYTYWTLTDNGQATLNDYNNWGTANSSSYDRTHQAVLGDTYTFSPAAVLDVRVSYLRQIYPLGVPESLGQDLSKFTTTPANYISALSGQLTPMLPLFSTTGAHSIYSVGRAGNNTQNTYDTYAASGSLIRIEHNHSLKFGTELRRMEDNTTANGGNAGTFTFDNSYTGDEWASFLMGYLKAGTGNGATGGSITLSVPSTGYNYYQSYYTTDVWQTTHKLTLTMGLRWELPGFIQEKNDKATVLLPNYKWTDASALNPSLTGILALVNSPIYGSRSNINVKYDLLAPRLGFAYRVANDTAVRGGYGLSYIAIDTKAAMPSASPINTSSTRCGSLLTNSSGASIPDPNQMMYNCFFPSNTPLIQPLGRSLNSASYMHANYVNQPKNAITGPVPIQSMPYVQQWNLSVSQQFKGGWVSEIGYAGTKGTHMPALGNVQFNQIADSYDAQGAALLKTAYCSATGTTITVGQCERPYPYYGGFSDTVGYRAGTIYHALQVKMQKRFKAGLLMANYTWAKQIGDTDANSGTIEESSSQGGAGTVGAVQDYNNMKAERTVLSYDVPQRAVISYVLNLPFGQGQRWGNNTSGVVGHVISGWGVNGITTFQKGFHVTLSANGIASGTYANEDLINSFGAGKLRPNVIAGCNKAATAAGIGRQFGWFNNSNVVKDASGNIVSQGCFAEPADFTFGNEPRVDSNLFAAGIDNFDFAALKTTKVTERVSLQFRAEVFNLFNRVQFGPPVTTLGSASFGDILLAANNPRLMQFSLRVNF